MKKIDKLTVWIKSILLKLVKALDKKELYSLEDKIYNHPMLKEVREKILKPNSNKPLHQYDITGYNNIEIVYCGTSRHNKIKSKVWRTMNV